MKTEDLGAMSSLVGLKLLPLDVHALNGYGEWHQGLFRKGIRALAELVPPQLTSKLTPTEFGFGEPGLYGPDSEHHAFRYRNYLRGFRLLEPQVTKMLQHLLNPETAGPDIGVDRCRAFLKAMFWASGTTQEVIGKFELDGKLHCLTVESEVGCGAGKDKGSLDLLISWKAEGERPRQVAIENKFGHHVTPGQLPRYKGQVLKNVWNNKDNAAFFVVAPEFDGKNAKAMKQNANYWKPVTWWCLLRYWELTLNQQSCKDQDEDFPRLRHALWTLGVGVD